MIIKSHIRGGYRSAAEYLKEQGKNEKIRLVEISDPNAKNLDEAFHNMWVVASGTKATKPLHHISINPMKDECLTDKQLLAIVERCEEKYGYKQFHHQRVIVEHIKEGRQHFHVIWNRVSLTTGKPVWPGEHWKKSKQICREMEKELGLMRPMPRSHKARSGKNFTSRKTGATTTRITITRTTTKCGGIASLKLSNNRIKSPRLFSHHGAHSALYSIPKTLTPHRPMSALLFPIRQEPIRPSLMPHTRKGGWPEAAIRDWQSWGHREPRRFFSLWPELSI